MCVCVYVCMCVRHAQKIAKLFFERAKHAAPFQIKYIIRKKIYQPLGPQNTLFCGMFYIMYDSKIFFLCLLRHLHNFCLFLLEIFVSLSRAMSDLDIYLILIKLSLNQFKK